MTRPTARQKARKRIEEYAPDEMSTIAHFLVDENPTLAMRAMDWVDQVRQAAAERDAMAPHAFDESYPYRADKMASVLCWHTATPAGANCLRTADHPIHAEEAS